MSDKSHLILSSALIIFVMYRLYTKLSLIIYKNDSGILTSISKIVYL